MTTTPEDTHTHTHTHTHTTTNLCVLRFERRQERAQSRKLLRSG